jgi:hypothetical protein
MGRPKRIYLRVVKSPRRLFLYPRCVHLSHRLLLPCWSAKVYDGFCARHNRRCWDC